MEKVFENQFITIYYESDKLLLPHYWTDKTAEMSDEDFRENISTILKFIIQKGAKNLLSDSMKFYFPISPESQEWVNTSFFPAVIKEGLKKYAIMMTTDFLSQLSIEQTIEEEAGQLLPVKYFDDEQKAREWIAK